MSNARLNPVTISATRSGVIARLKIYFDGGYRPMPGGMETAVVIRGEAHVRRTLGEGSSIDAEWLALIEALRLARARDLSDFVLLGDCAPVIAQARQTARCGAAYTHHRDTARALAPPGRPLRLRLIPRAQNLAGIALARAHPR